jgi:site-specific recombinase
MQASGEEHMRDSTSLTTVIAWLRASSRKEGRTDRLEYVVMLN